MTDIETQPFETQPFEAQSFEAQPFEAQSFEPWPDGVDVHVESTIVAAGLAAERGDIVVIVDVLSFSTTVSIAVDRGAEVLVYSGDEIEARGGREAIARELEADIIATGRVADGARFTLSPGSLATIGPEDRVIFTSWNGAACVAAASTGDRAAPAVLIGSLLNRSAVADVVVGILGDQRSQSGEHPRCTIVAASEHWSSSVPGLVGIRPSYEDTLGAGAIAHALAAHGLVLSVEAAGAAAVFDHARGDIGGMLRGCVSGRELIARGFANDVDHASRLDVFATVPIWREGDPARTFADHDGVKG